MRRIASPLATAIGVPLLVAITLSIGLPLMRAERQAGTNDRAAALIIPSKPVPMEFLFVVTSTGDGDNVGPGAVCDDGTGNCTLRAAIEVANANFGDDTIEFDIPTTDPGYDPGTGSWTINLPRPLPAVSESVSISGPGPTKLTVRRSSGGDYGIFIVTATGTVTFSGLTISNGSTNNGGGGILNIGTTGTTGTVNLTNCVLSGNTARDGGGGISNFRGTLNVTNSTLSGNIDFGNAGGGIFNHSGTVTITNSTLSGNSTLADGGGGIQNFENFGTSATVNIINSTLSGNSAPTEGGGINNFSSSGTSTVNVNNSTISNNLASNGGGIFNGSGTVNVKSSIIALNTAGTGPQVSGAFISSGFNLIGKTDGSTGFTQPTDRTGTVASPLDPKLDPAGLQNNGGPTQTIALLPGSLAINNGAPDSPATDQRGLLRPEAPDIGAFEFGGFFYPVALANISTRGFVGTFDNVMIGGFIVSGNGNKLVLLRAIGPSLSNPPINLGNTLQDPTLSLFNSSGGMIISNDNWSDASNAQSIDPSLRPSNGAEPAILISLAPGAYTAIVSGANGGTGIGLVEVFDLDAAVPSKLSNISTRGLVETGDEVMIGGFIVKGPDSDKVVVRAIGPSLASPPFNLTNVLQNPTLSLFDANGMMFASNDDWRSTQEADIIATGLQPTDDAESAIVTTLTPGNYTAIVRGAGGSTGIALVEVYGLN